MESGFKTVSVLLLILCSICTITFAQEQCASDQRNCGEFCCGNSTTCCATSESCCAPDENNMPATCGENMCPGPSLPADEYYDTNAVGDIQLRNRCCVYFRSGCCSDRENNSLDLLFKLAIGLSIGLFGLLVIIGLLIACCCCCICC